MKRLINFIVGLGFTPLKAQLALWLTVGAVVIVILLIFGGWIGSCGKSETPTPQGNSNAAIANMKQGELDRLNNTLESSDNRVSEIENRQNEAAANTANAKRDYSNLSDKEIGNRLKERLKNQ